MGFSGHTSQPAIYGTTIAFTVLACITVLLRLLTRLFIARKAGWDDIFISVAAVFTILLAVSICKQAQYGMGLHVDDLADGSLRSASRWLWSFFWIYYAGLGCTKLSMLSQYLRVFPHANFRELEAVLMSWYGC